jgi:hypothetical protein
MPNAKDAVRVGDRCVGDDKSGGWKVMERKVLLGEVLRERWVGDRRVGVDRRVGDDESGGW